MAIDRGIIDQQLKDLGGETSRLWDHRELRDLPAILDADEEILAITRGKIARLRWLRSSWLIVVTDRRLLCVCSARRAGWRQMEVHADQIVRVALRIGPFRGRVRVVTEGSLYRLLVPKLDAFKLANAISSVAGGQSVMAGFGPANMMRRVIDHVLALPAAALDPGPAKQPPVTRALPPAVTTDPHAELLEAQVHELQRQVEFLEQLLRQRHDNAVISPQADAG